ncbi:MAG TPA: hypothetical protein VKF41_00710 [Bryobacteraceae bacterium]|nr:hypothetical protein [Bryobacteraceae bacterium]
MSPRTTALLLAGCLLLPAAADKTVASASGENDDISLTVTLHLDPAEIKQMVDSDLSGHFVLAEVTVAPKYGKEVAVAWEDFVLMDTDHNDRSKPFAANQIVGPAVIIQRGPADDGTQKKPRQRPRLSGPFGIGGGGQTADTARTDPSQVKVHEEDGPKDTPLEKALAARMVPQGKTVRPAQGLLFFALEKPRMKDLQLTYGGKENRIVLRFR